MFQWSLRTTRYQPQNQYTGIVLAHAPVVLSSLPQCSGWETARANTTEKVRSGRYDGFDLRKLTIPSNPVPWGLRVGWTATIHYHSRATFCARRLLCGASIRTDSLDKRMRHASRPGRWWSHNETDRGGATAPRKGRSKPLVQFFRASIPRAMTLSVISSIVSSLGCCFLTVVVVFHDAFWSLSQW